MRYGCNCSEGCSSSRPQILSETYQREESDWRVDNHYTNAYDDDCSGSNDGSDDDTSVMRLLASQGVAVVGIRSWLKGHRYKHPRNKCGDAENTDDSDDAENDDEYCCPIIHLRSSVAYNHQSFK